MAETKEYGNILGGDQQSTAINQENFAYEQQLLATQYNQAFGRLYVMNSLVNGTTLAAAAGAWAAFPTPTQITAATIPSPTIIVAVTVASMSVAGHYEIKLFTGPAGVETEIAHVCISGTTTLPQNIPVGALVPAGSRLSASIASAQATADTITLKVMYREYSAAPVAP